MAALQDQSACLAVLYRDGHYALTIYVSGLSVECLFRGFRGKMGLPFRSDHSLEPLSEEAGFPDVVPAADRQQFVTAFGDVLLRWRNSHRFRSNDAVRRYLKGLKLDRGIKGDFLKENARIASSAAIELIGIGIRLWKQR